MKLKMKSKQIKKIKRKTIKKHEKTQERGDRGCAAQWVYWQQNGVVGLNMESPR